MSASAILLPIAISISLSIIAASAESAKTRLKQAKAASRSSVVLETRFSDVHLLVKTLQEHGVFPIPQSNGDILVRFDDGRIVYRQRPDGHFDMEVDEIRDIQRLIDEFDCIESEYNGNVQTYTCERVKANLPGNMSIMEEQLLDDNSILLTLSVD